MMSISFIPRLFWKLPKKKDFKYTQEVGKDACKSHLTLILLHFSRTTHIDQGRMQMENIQLEAMKNAVWSWICQLFWGCSIRPWKEGANANKWRTMIVWPHATALTWKTQPMCEIHNSLIDSPKSKKKSLQLREVELTIEFFVLTFTPKTNSIQLQNSGQIWNVFSAQYKPTTEKWYFSKLSKIGNLAKFCEWSVRFTKYF